MNRSIQMLVLSSCAAICCACSTVEYVKRGDIDGNMYKDVGYVNGERSKYGALRLNVDEDSRIFMLRKQSGVYTAETLLSDQSTKPNKTFNQAFMSFGGDRKNDMVGLRFRLTFD